MSSSTERDRRWRRLLTAGVTVCGFLFAALFEEVEGQTVAGNEVITGLEGVAEAKAVTGAEDVCTSILSADPVRNTRYERVDLGEFGGGNGNPGYL